MEQTMAGYETGDTVKWDWGNGTAKGKITQRFESDVTRTIKGTEVTREADGDDPAYLIQQEDGDEVLKSHSEVEKA